MHPYLRFHILVKPTDEGARRRPGRHLEVLYPSSEPGPSTLTSPRLRRVLGKALLDGFCPFGVPRCETPTRAAPRATPAELCHLADSCPYGVLYAGSRSRRPPFALYVAAADPGGPEVIEVSLYGSAWRAYPWLLSALERALGTGLGKDRQRWRIERIFKVTVDGRRRKLCGRDLASLPADLGPEHFRLTADRYLPPQPMAVEFLSPTRLVRDGRLLPRGKPVTFDLLVARILDRFHGLYGDGASELVRPPVRAEIEEAASRVPLLRDDTRWIEVRDYSARTGSELLLGGLSGRLVYGEPAARFLPVLRAGEVLHLGKNPASGCGRMRIDMSRPSPTISSIRKSPT